jgi:hypothetical protein
MSRSLLRQARSHGRAVVGGGAVCALATVATLLVTGSAQASDPTPPTASPSCDLATLKGTYLFEGNGALVSGTTTTAFAGIEHFNGAGAVTGSSTFSSGGTIFPRSAFTGTYTLTAGCTGTLTIGTTLHFDIYVAPSGDKFTYIQTDPGSVSAATETRVSRT